MKTITGFSVCGAFGVHTLSTRQSSLVVLSKPPPCSEVLIWGQAGPSFVAGFVPLQAGAGCGGRKRSAPTGGAAYGMPRNARVVPSLAPSTEPCMVGIVVPIGIEGAFAPPQEASNKQAHNSVRMVIALWVGCSVVLIF